MSDQKVNRMLESARARRPGPRIEPSSATLAEARARGAQRRADATQKGVDARLDRLRDMTRGKGRDQAKG